MHRFLQNIIDNNSSSELNPHTSISNADNVPHTKPIRPILVIGKIYASWCGHCITLEPKWEVVEESLNKHFPITSELLIHNVEESDMNDEKKGLGILQMYVTNADEKVDLQGGFPTIYKIVNGKVTYYDGPREVVPMTKWALQGLPRHSIKRNWSKKSMSKYNSKSKSKSKSNLKSKSKKLRKNYKSIGRKTRRQ